MNEMNEQGNALEGAGERERKRGRETRRKREIVRVETSGELYCSGGIMGFGRNGFPARTERDKWRGKAKVTAQYRLLRATHAG